jgi:hypothetical protein
MAQPAPVLTVIAHKYPLIFHCQAFQCVKNNLFHKTNYMKGYKSEENKFLREWDH